jgi:hypothetical protein
MIAAATVLSYHLLLPTNKNFRTMLMQVCLKATFTPMDGGIHLDRYRNLMGYSIVWCTTALLPIKEFRINLCTSYQKGKRQIVSIDREEAQKGWWELLMHDLWLSCVFGSLQGHG